MAQDIGNVASIFDMSGAPPGGAPKVSPDDILDLAKQGQSAINQGKVSVAEAKATQKKLGLDTPEGAHDVLSTLIGGGQPQQSPYNFGPPQAAAPAAPPPKSYSKNIKTGSTNNSETKTRSVEADQGTLDHTFDMLRNTPEFQSQQAGIGDMEKQYQNMAGKANPNDAWIKSLLAYGDSLNGTNQAAAFEPQAAKRSADLQKFANDIQQRKGDLSKAILDSFSKFKAVSDQTAAAQKAGTTINVGTGATGPNGSMPQSPEDKTWARVQPMLESARGNPAVAQAEKDRYASAKVNSLMNLYPDPNNMPATQVNLLASEAAKIASGGAPTMTELQGIEPNTLQKMFSTALSKVDNKVTPANAGMFLKELSRYADAVSHDAEGVIKDKYGRIIESNKEGLGPKHYADAQAQYIGRFEPKTPVTPNVVTPPSNKPKTVIQGGHTYTLNAAGEYE